MSTVHGEPAWLSDMINRRKGASGRPGIGMPASTSAFRALFPLPFVYYRENGNPMLNFHKLNVSFDNKK